MNSSESEADEDFVFDLPDKLKNKTKQRSSVSAEAYGKFNKKSSYIPRVIPKTEEQIERIKGTIGLAFMFSALEDNELKIVVDSMEIVNKR